MLQRYNKIGLKTLSSLFHRSTSELCSCSPWSSQEKLFAALVTKEEDLRHTHLPPTAPRTYDPLAAPRKRWQPRSKPRKRPPENQQGQVLYRLSHKDLKSLTNQAIHALKKATQWQGGELESGAMMHCLQSAAASRKKAFQLIRGQMLLVPKLSPLVVFATEGFVGKIGARTLDKDWTLLRNQEVKYDDSNCIVHHLVGYRVEERGLTDDDIIAKRPGPAKSPTSYQAYFKKDYIRCRPDWVMNVTLDADKAGELTDRNRGKHGRRPAFRSRRSQFDPAEGLMRTLEEVGTPWYWLHNAWEGRLKVFRHSTPHEARGKFELVQEFDLDGEGFDESWRAMPFEDTNFDLRTVLGYRENRQAYA